MQIIITVRSTGFVYPCGERWVIEDEAGKLQIAVEGKRTFYKTSAAAIRAAEALLRRNVS